MYVTTEPWGPESGHGQWLHFGLGTLPLRRLVYAYFADRAVMRGQPA